MECLEEMNIYRVSCMSKCQSYFVDYLQWVDIIADNHKEALLVAKEEVDGFILSEDEWEVEKVCDGVRPGIVSYHYDSDY